jgi:transcriptional regulator with XRE-family HTH domain
VKDSISVRFRTRLKELRTVQHLTQEQAAERCDLSVKTYQFYESGLRSNPRLSTLEKLARGFGVDVSALLSRR